MVAELRRRGRWTSAVQGGGRRAVKLDVMYTKRILFESTFLLAPLH